MIRARLFIEEAFVGYVDYSLVLEVFRDIAGDFEIRRIGDDIAVRLGPRAASTAGGRRLADSTLGFAL